MRGTITSEMWKTLNSTGLEIRRYQPDAPGSDIAVFPERVRYWAHLSRGVTLGAMLRDDAFRFTRIGTSLEGADATARMLLALARPGLPPADEPAGPDDYAWTLLLRSPSAFEVYRKVHRDAVTPWRVTQLLVLRDELPRSLHRCVNEVYENLRAVANDQSAESERRAGAWQSAFRFGRLEHLLSPGLDVFLGNLLERSRDLGLRISQDFLVPAATYRPGRQPACNCTSATRRPTATNSRLSTRSRACD